MFNDQNARRLDIYNFQVAPHNCEQAQQKLRKLNIIQAHCHLAYKPSTRLSNAMRLYFLIAVAFGDRATAKPVDIDTASGIAVVNIPSTAVTTPVAGSDTNPASTPAVNVITVREAKHKKHKKKKKYPHGKPAPKDTKPVIDEISNIPCVNECLHRGSNTWTSNP